jgi:hypothetical protein
MMFFTRTGSWGVQGGLVGSKEIQNVQWYQS